jgi:hypothetical protein
MRHAIAPSRVYLDSLLAVFARQLRRRRTMKGNNEYGRARNILQAIEGYSSPILPFRQPPSVPTHI